MRSLSRVVWLIVLGMIVLFIDFVSKAYVYYLIPLNESYGTYPYGGIGVFRDFFGIDFAISLTINKGAAWGLFADFQLLLLLIRILTIIGMLGYLFFMAPSRKYDLPFVLIISGALGNVIDFFSYGFVIDFFHFTFWGHHFAVFNVADAAITLGIVLLILSAFFQKVSQARRGST